MSDSYSHFTLICKEAVGNGHIETLRMLRHIQFAVRTGKDRMLVILEHDLKDEFFEMIANTVLSLRFASEIVDTGQAVDYHGDHLYRADVFNMFRDCEPKLASDGDVEKFVIEYRHWRRTMSLVDSALFNRG